MYIYVSIYTYLCSDNICVCLHVDMENMDVVVFADGNRMAFILRKQKISMFSVQ